MDRLEDEEATRIMTSHLVQLMEHFDSVHLFATRHDPTTQVTISYQKGAGNHYASVGQILQWLDKERQD